MIEVYTTVASNDVISSLARLADRLNGREAADFLQVKAQPYLRKRITNRFVNEGDDVVGPWPQLARATGFIRQRQAAANGWRIGMYHPINIRSGALRRWVAFTYTLTPSRNNALLVIPHTPPGDIAEKLKVSMLGGFAHPGAKRTPQRRVIGMNGKDRDDITALADRWFTEVLNTL